MADPKLSEIQARVNELEQIVNDEQQQIQDLIASQNATITGLNGVIADLETQVADGGTPAERQAVLDKIVAIKTDIESTVGGESPGAGGENGGGDTPVV